MMYHNYNNNPTMSQCEIIFVDCLGYYDLGAEVINILFIMTVMVITVKNFKKLLAERASTDESSLKKSLLRKINVSVSSIIYLAALLLQVIFSITLFFMIGVDRKDVVEAKLNYWYKFFELTCVNLLNILVLTVGFLYWKALRAYYQLSNLTLPFRYSQCSKSIFIIVYSYQIGMIIAIFVALLVFKNIVFSQDLNAFIGFLNLAGTFFVMALWTASKLLYNQEIIKEINMTPEAMAKERIYSIIILLSSLTRITLYLVGILKMSYISDIRHFDSSCNDTSPGNAIFLLCVTFFVNLLPPFAFTRIFAASQLSRLSDIRRTFNTFRTSSGHGIQFQK